MRDQVIRATGEGRKEPLHLLAGEHRGEALGPLGAVDGPDIAKLHADHLAPRRAPVRRGRPGH